MPVQPAAQVITRCLEEQPEDAPSDIEITEEKLSFTVQDGGLMGWGKRPAPTTLYFDSLGRLELFKRKGLWIVKVWNDSGIFRFRVIVANRERAERFIDAMSSMGTRAKSR